MAYPILSVPPKVPRSVVSPLLYATGRVIPVRTLSKPPLLGAPGLAASPDGSHFLLTEVEREENNLMLLKSFQQ